MKRLSASTRISIGLACLTMSALFAAQSLGLMPSAEQAVIAGRKALCESLAVQCSLAAQRNDIDTIRSTTLALVERNPTLLSAVVRRSNGKVIVQAGIAPQKTTKPPTGVLPLTHVEVPVFQGQKRWGTIELRFEPVTDGSRFGWLNSPATRLIIFVACVGFLAYSWYLKRVLQHLDPSAVIPDRVRETLDTLAEGVLVLDKEQRIVLANQAFARFIGRSSNELQGFKAPDIPWSHLHSESEVNDYPWTRAIADGVSQTGVMIGIQSKTEGLRTLVVNTAPILGGDGRQRGALATFDDVTSVEQKNLQLEEMLQVLNASRDEIRRQNEELQLLATRDSLTGCLNRRAFFTQFDTCFKTAQSREQPLGCIMVDVDHFKLINDNHGHSLGDQVLQHVANVLKTTVGERGLVCRYGGEEFCVLLPNVALAMAIELAEELRKGLAAEQIGGLQITASLGVTGIELGAGEPGALLDQADKALYASKHDGRNRVTSYEDLPADFEVSQPQPEKKQDRSEESEVTIPFHAVTALMAALSFRDVHTAEHSRRVADLSVLTARGLMCERDCYVMEVAALLHDIGKLGVPDAILLKPGSLTDEEWKVMSAHDRIGVEIIMAAFSSPELAEIVRTHHAWYAGNPREPLLPKGDDIPLRARILTIADSYDAIVSNRVYRKARSQEEAFQELRRCAGRQFDPKLVERFIEVVSSNDSDRIHSSLPVPKQAALRIGLQIERLAGALDAQDFTNLSVMAGRLAVTANKEGVEEIAQLAADLERMASSEPKLMEIVKTTTDLLELCRATQTAYLSSSSDEAE